MVYQDTCSSLRELHLKDEGRKLLSKVIGIEILEMKHPEFCCGFGSGLFAIQHEAVSVAMAEKKIKDWRLNGYSMLVSLEPCDMCSLVIAESRLDQVYYVVSKKGNSNYNSFDINKSKLNGFDDYTFKFNKLLTDFFDDKR